MFIDFVNVCVHCILDMVGYFMVIGKVIWGQDYMLISLEINFRLAFFPSALQKRKTYMETQKTYLEEIILYE